MIAGRTRGHVSLSREQGFWTTFISQIDLVRKVSRMVISILCLPLVAGYFHPPQLRLPNVDEASCNPSGPHLVCVLPPVLSSSFCVPVAC
ncbi:trafficking protein particle complex II-specific subunit 130-like [Quillaja saponaria]|uniref:Trafficking protein particle complex II-specific subunit 130-like n=1 Tax=Quillaja saponaria TaxID=32244 RepID=A0AAD7KZC7_QUISA|nr:trafficking protein particle complex II-specific subunit 130-like [Quillaja saponaria]